MGAKNQKSSKKSRNGFKIELGLARSLTLGGFVVLAMIWSFILGVFVGRGYNPEDVIPEIARVMPDSIRERPEIKTLRPEDLEFFDRLRSDTSEHTPPPAAEDQTAALTRPEPRIEAVPEPPPPSRPEPVEETYIYSYQVGAFQTMDRAIRMQKQLMDQGFTASIADAFVENEPWYRVIVEFQSSDRGAEAMIRKLERLGISRPIFRGRRSS